jgi:rhamnose transport system substrate-binding protein
VVDGTITGKEGDKFTAGTLKEYTVGKNGTVVLGDPFVFTAENIDQFKF